MAFEAIVRVRQRQPLFEEVCRVLVERGQLRMAWLGEIDDHGGTIPTAHVGVADGHLDDLRITVRDVPEGRGATGTAARERRPMLIAEIATDERMAPWRDAALARGYRSSAAFPLALDDRCVVVLAAYASAALVIPPLGRAMAATSQGSSVGAECRVASGLQHAGNGR